MSSLHSWRLWRLVVPVGVAALIAGVLGAAAQRGRAAGAAEPDIAIRRDIVFGKGGDVELKLDLARPPSGDGPFPLVVCVHGAFGASRSGATG